VYIPAAKRSVDDSGVGKAGESYRGSSKNTAG